MAINIPVSWGELVDKITILEIKLDRIHDDTKRQNISRELQALQSVFDQGCEHPQKIIQIKAKLRAVNEQLWDIEDDIRKCEKEKDFSQRFTDLARSVYMTNDRRADLKCEINTILQSELFEEKSYEDYS